jgi:hypothetical protein
MAPDYISVMSLWAVCRHTISGKGEAYV